MGEETFVVQIKIDVSGIPGAQKSVDALGGSALNLNAALELAAKGYALLKTAILAPINQFRALVDISTDLVHAYDGEFRAQTKLLAILKATGQGGAAQAQQFIKLADALQEVTRFENDAIVAGQAFALGADVPIEQIERFTIAALDLATVLDIDVQQGFLKLNQAVQTGSIRNYAKDITNATTEGERLNDVLGFIEKNLAGQARAAALAGAGPLIQLKNLYDDMEESIGKLVSQTPEFIGFINALKEGTRAITAFVAENRAEITLAFGRAFVVSFQIAAKAIELFIDILDKAQRSVSAILNVLDDLSASNNPLIPSFDSPFKGLADQIEKATFKANALRAVMEQAGEEIVNVLPPGAERESSITKLANEFLPKVAAADAELERLQQRLQQLKSGSGFGDLIGQVRTLAGEIGGLGNRLLDQVAPNGISQAVAEQIEAARLAQARAEFEHELAGQNFGGDGDSAISASQRTQDREFQERWKPFIDEAADNTGKIRDVFNSALGSMTNAITTFVTTGKLDFKEFARSAIADITQILVRTLLLKAIFGVAGSAGGAPGAPGSDVQFGPEIGRAGGGPVFPAGNYIVGERGPEKLSVGQQGRVSPMGAGGSPQVNVRVINVRSEDEIAQAIASGRLDREFVSVIQRNPGLGALLSG